MKKVKFESSYVLRPAANCELDNPVLYAEVSHFTEVNGIGTPSSEPNIEVYKSPEGFCNEITEALQMQIGDELIDKGIMPEMRITIRVEYTTNPANK